MPPARVRDDPSGSELDPSFRRRPAGRSDLVSTGLHTVLLVALGLIVVGTAGTSPRGGRLAIGLGGGTAAEGDLDDTSFGVAGSSAAGDDGPSEENGANPADLDTSLPDANGSLDSPLLALDDSAPSDLAGASWDPAASTLPAAPARMRRMAAPLPSSPANGLPGGPHTAQPVHRAELPAARELPVASPARRPARARPVARAAARFLAWRQAGRMVFVVDVSGSMHGKRIRRAQTELRQTLKALKPTQKFYIVFFSDGAVPCPRPGLLPATRENVALACQWVQAAECGGAPIPLPASGWPWNCGPTRSI